MITRKGDIQSEIREQMRGGNGRAVMTKLSGALPEKMRIFSTISLMPGDSIGYHVHEGETELFYFVKGSCKVNDNHGEEAVLTAGDVLSTPSGHGHSVENVGDDEVLMVAVIVLD